ncbi:MAG: EF-hand domain-containing protein [Candidatus Hydrogenedentes bacterium]|nr:EF-hand domain-containing protein [Candidatus Hydrogenedentota bacterium]
MKGLYGIGLTAALIACGAWGADEAKPAPGAGGGKGSLFQRADTNKDGKLSQDEVKEKAPRITESQFKTMDKNGDGFLVPQEMRRGQGPMGGGAGGNMADRLRKADTDGDKAVSKEEFGKAFPKARDDAFGRMDTNKDGKLTPEDRTAGGGQGRMDMMKRMKAADKDQDGAVSEEEYKAAFPNAPANRFKTLDRNGDGKLTPADRPEQGAKPGAAAAGQAEGKGIRHLIEDADSDKDGSVTYEELTAKKAGFPKEQFDRLDRNDDGKLSKADMRQQQPGKKQADKPKKHKKQKTEKAETPATPATN